MQSKYDINKAFIYKREIATSQSRFALQGDSAHRLFMHLKRDRN